MLRTLFLARNTCGVHIHPHHKPTDKQELPLQASFWMRLKGEPHLFFFFFEIFILVSYNDYIIYMERSDDTYKRRR